MDDPQAKSVLFLHLFPFNIRPAATGAGTAGVGRSMFDVHFFVTVNGYDMFLPPTSNQTPLTAPEALIGVNNVPQGTPTISLTVVNYTCKYIC